VDLVIFNACQSQIELVELNWEVVLTFLALGIVRDIFVI
jgi:hypothetical protein